MNIEKYTQNAQQAIMDCQNIAISEGHQMLDGEHLHLALMMQKDGFSWNIQTMSAKQGSGSSLQTCYSMPSSMSHTAMRWQMLPARIRK